MQIYHHIHSLREVLSEARVQGKRVGVVPTMGNLHAAHIALIKTAQLHCDVVVCTIFVNRLQFGLNEDWDRYPRTLESDSLKLNEAGCDFLFCPEEQEIYPNGMDSQARVRVPCMADTLCGKSRPGHFDGVTTVVAKLFNIIQPDIAVFGIKDFQQLAIVRRMAEDLCMPVGIIAGDIVREPDGLAMSSRNGFILAEERPRANQLNQSLSWICEQIASGERDFHALEQEAKQQISESGFKPDYVQICNSRTLESAAHDDAQITVLGAMYTQHARLIDNISLSLKPPL
ncbi:MAG: pantoate--beta-alanine ligase [Alteromonadaceae bacterium]|nr:MAG: pantoate--beta-alanine ligase [Alteromonadaceae bacterium]